MFAILCEPVIYTFYFQKKEYYTLQKPLDINNEGNITTLSRGKWL